MVAPPKSSILIGFSIIFTIQFEVSRYPYFWKHPNIAAYIYIYQEISKTYYYRIHLFLSASSRQPKNQSSHQPPCWDSPSSLLNLCVLARFFGDPEKLPEKFEHVFFCWPKMDDSIFWLSTEATGHLLTSSLLKQHLEWAGVMLVLLVLP